VPTSLNLISNLPEYISATLHQGFANAFPDEDGIYRHAALVTMVGGFPHPSLPLAIANTGLKSDAMVSFSPQRSIQSLSFDDAHRLPVNEAGRAEINYRGPSYTFRYLSARDILRDDDKIRDDVNQKLTGKSKHELLNDAYVLLGVTALAAGDMGATPTDPLFPGIESVATVLDNTLSNDFMHSGAGSFVSWSILALMLLGAGGIATLFFLVRPSRVLLISGGVILAAMICDARFVFANAWDCHTGFLYLGLIGTLLLGMVSQDITREG
jgi:adenylate cyclase